MSDEADSSHNKYCSGVTYVNIKPLHTNVLLAIVLAAMATVGRDTEYPDPIFC